MPTMNDSTEPEYESTGVWEGRTITLTGCKDPDCTHSELSHWDHYGHPTEVIYCYDCDGHGALPDDDPALECTQQDCWHMANTESKLHAWQRRMGLRR